MSRLTVVVLTYSPSEDHPRTRYAKRCVEALLQNLEFSGDLDYHFADDGSFDGHIARLVTQVEAKGFLATDTNAERGGYGRSFNLATQATHDRSDYLLMVEDDWEL